jgi:hypothetical protein
LAAKEILAIDGVTQFQGEATPMLAIFGTKPRRGVRWHFTTGDHPDQEGIFDSLGARLARWPSGYEPTSTNLNIAFKIIAAMPRYGIEVSDKALRQAFDERASEHRA